MLRVVSRNDRPRFRSSVVARVNRALAGAGHWLKVAFLTAFPIDMPEPPSPSPLTKSAALREGALLREDLDAESGKRVA
jgi:hypothetical protein